MIQWYPGHMAKAKKLIQAQLKRVDLVLEIRDARVPLSSANPMFADLFSSKMSLLVLTKADLADKKVTETWVQYLKNGQTEVVALNAKNSSHVQGLRQKIQQIASPLQKKWQNKGMKKQPIRVMVTGIPNVGKSTLINQLLKRKVAAIGNKPGITKGEQWLTVDKDLSLLDTPGVLWPKFEEQTTAYKLAVIGAIKETHYHADDVCLFALEVLIDHYPALLKKAYSLSDTDLEIALPELLLHITKKMDLRDDYDEASQRILRELRNGRLGAFSFEFPNSELVADGK